MAPGYYVYGYSTFAYVPANGDKKGVPPFPMNFSAMNIPAEAVKPEMWDTDEQTGPIGDAAGGRTGSQDTSADAGVETGAPSAEANAQPAVEEPGAATTESDTKAEEADDEMMNDISSDDDSDDEPAFTKPKDKTSEKGKCVQPATRAFEPLKPTKSKSTPALPGGTRRSEINRFRITMGLLPHSSKTAKVTSEMKDALESKFSKLDDTRQREFIDCLRASVSKITLKRCITSNGFGTDNIDFQRLSYKAYHDLNLFLKVNQLTEDKDGEGRKMRALIRKITKEDRERKAALEKARDANAAK